MGMNPVTDLFYTKYERRAEIFQPQATAGMEIADFRLMSYQDLEKIWRQVMELQFVHVGALAYKESGPDLQIVGFKSCGGAISFSSISSDDRKEKFEWATGLSELGVCQKSDCGLEAGFMHKAEAQRLLFFLGLKQMFPQLGSCNFINLARCADKRNEKERKTNPLNGLIGVREQTLLYKKAQLLPFIPPDVVYAGDSCSIGFTIIEGVNTLDGFGGLDFWTRFLFFKKERFQKKAVENLEHALYGPSPSR